VRGCVEAEGPVIRKSPPRDRIVENAAIFDFGLSSDDMAELDALDTTGGADQAVGDEWWGGTPNQDPCPRGRCPPSCVRRHGPLSRSLDIRWRATRRGPHPPPASRRLPCRRRRARRRP